jgi:hypothetical protein
MLITEGSLAGGHCTEFVQCMFDDLVAGPGNANLPKASFKPPAQQDGGQIGVPKPATLVHSKTRDLRPASTQLALKKL